MITRVAPEMVRYDLGPLLALARTFGRSPSQAEGLRLALTQAAALTGASAGFIQTTRDDYLQLAAQVGLPPRFAEGLLGLRDGHGLEKMGKSWEELISFSPGDGNLPSDLQSLCRVEGVTSGLILPLRAGGPLRGLLVLLTQSSDRLTPGDPHLLVALGRWVGLTLDRAALEEEVHRQSDQIQALTSQHARLHDADLLAHAQRQRQAAQALTEVGKALTQSLSLSKVLSLVVERSRALMEASAAVVYRWDHEEQVLRCLEQTGLDLQLATALCLQAGEGVAGTVFAEQRSVWSADVRTDPTLSLRPETLSLLQWGGVFYPGVLAVPINLGGRPYGVLMVLYDRPHTFTSDDVEYLTSFADLVAIALQNATLYEQLQVRLEELWATQLQLIQSEKLSAIGQLVSGVAHELNNPLTTILGNAQLLMSEPPNPQMRRRHERINHEALRCARIVENLLTVARERPPERVSLDLNRTLEVVLDLRAHQLELGGIRLVRDLSEDLPPVQGDPSRLQQVFLNLLVNAEQAIGSSAGVITMRTRKKGHEWIRVEVEDTGPGIAEKLLGRIFDPFFTTKPPGQGTGLGLSISASIVAEHGGRLWAESPPEGGARFIVELPVTTPPPRSTTSDPKPLASTVSYFPRRRILVVDDETGVREVLAETLSSLGQEVVMAGTAAEAFARVAEGPFDIILQDLRLPDQDGRDVWRVIHQRDPELASRIVFITGDIVNPQLLTFLAETGATYLSKPLKIEEIHALLA